MSTSVLRHLFLARTFSELFEEKALRRLVRPCFAELCINSQVSAFYGTPACLFSFCLYYNCEPAPYKSQTFCKIDLVYSTPRTTQASDDEVQF